MPLVKSTTYSPSLTFADIKFYPHTLARGSYPDQIDFSYFSNLYTRMARVTFENGFVVSIVTGLTTLISEVFGVRETFGLFNGEADCATYEVCISEGEIIDYVSFGGVMNILKEVNDRTGKSGEIGDLMAEEFNPPRNFYHPDLHGAFIFRDEHVDDSSLTTVFLHNWHSVTEQFGDPSRAVMGLNRWCQENCNSEYAWTCSGPVWVFRDFKDAISFRVTWS